jgi:glycerate 2-kinase
MVRTAPGAIVLAPDKFKGSLSAAEVAHHLREGIRATAPHISVLTVPVADGGEGTVEAALAQGFRPVSAPVRGPVGVTVDAVIAVRGTTAIVELAQASGLQHTVPTGLAPMTANTYGCGELIRLALDHGCSSIVLGLGGSSSTDGGAGMVQALGARLTDERGAPIPPGDGHARFAHGLDVSALDARIRDTTFIVASDVDNPLNGPQGAAAVFAPQKGADPHEVEQLDSALRRWAGLVSPADSRLAKEPGAGAAGGVGFVAFALLGASMRPGIDVMLDLVNFPRLVDGSSLVVTGEGSLDQQSLGGKAPLGVARAARRAGVHTVAVAGRTTLSSIELINAGFAATFTLQDLEPDLQVCLAEAPRLLQEVGEKVGRLEDHAFGRRARRRGGG